MIIKKILLPGILIFVVGINIAAEKKDPGTRDEDISSSTLEVEYMTRVDGLTEYVYRLENPTENKGIIHDLEIDLRCGASFESVSLPYPEGAEGYDLKPDNASPHTPTAVIGDFGASYMYGVTSSGAAYWGIYSQPGEVVTGLRLVSSAGPGMRTYMLTPYWDNDESWNYPVEPDPDIPVVDDFIVTGMIAAPACPGVTAPPGNNMRFAGSQKKKESDVENQLLTYATPERDKFHVEAGTKSYDFHVYYSDDIDPDTFKVKPKSLQGYFNPFPGQNEIVTLPLGKKSTKIELSVYSTQNAVDGDTAESEKKSSFKDRDEFEIRVDEGS